MLQHRHRRKRPHPLGSYVWTLWLGVGLLLGGFLLRGYRAALRPVIVTAATDHLANQIEDEICGVVEELLDEGGMEYQNICTIYQDSEGQMRGLKTDMTRLNRLKTEISTRVAEEFDEDLVSHRVDVPLGSLFYHTACFGGGPKVPVVVLSVGNVSAEVDNEFSDAGINQTRHQVALRVRTRLHLLLPGEVYDYTEETRLVLAETVLMGDVPESYSNFEQTDAVKRAYENHRYYSAKKN